MTWRQAPPSLVIPARHGHKQPDYLEFQNATIGRAHVSLDSREQTALSRNTVWFLLRLVTHEVQEHQSGRNSLVQQKPQRGHAQGHAKLSFLSLWRRCYTVHVICTVSASLLELSRRSFASGEWTVKSTWFTKRKAQMKSDPDYYAILQVDPHAEPEVIQAAYRRLAAKHHPDVNPSPEAMVRMKLLNAAYEVLTDPVKRQIYDMSRLGTKQQTVAGASTRRRPWWFLVLAVVVLLLLLRFNARLFLIAGAVFLALWLLMNWQRQRK